MSQHLGGIGRTPRRRGQPRLHGPVQSNLGYATTAAATTHTHTITNQRNKLYFSTWGCSSLIDTLPSMLQGPTFYPQQHKTETKGVFCLFVLFFGLFSLFNV